ncbi:hypothetical protein V6N11_009853 [Hibiscus sabdariffa]|uniref:F-box domain-containing protein n=1 Tax=Hibiscus sabdariffa TaxID=183260 RepID=A0ABR1ZXJ3_9ROSI
MEIFFNPSIALQSQQSLILATLVTLLPLLLAVRSLFKKPNKSNVSAPATSAGKEETRQATPSSSCNGTADSAAFLNGGRSGPVEEEMVTADVCKVMAEMQSGASMMEQLVPEITTHALSYLDYPSLCRLSMTNSLMRKAANDDNAWKALYHKDFTLEQDSVTPVNGWKAYYAATRAIMNVNTEFFNIVRDRSTLFRVRDVRARVLTDMAWVTMKTFVDMDTGPFNMTNVFEFHHGRWYLVHHHSSVMLPADGDMEQQLVVHG